uniref:ABC1 atypical kinase-like domain-containing protein n=2 Tax=Araucaria cunninghamii TaxID=56994 RepID=A0A0D6R1D5_ARACU
MEWTLIGMPDFYQMLCVQCIHSYLNNVMSWRHFLKREVDHRTNVSYLSATRVSLHGSITKVGRFFSSQTLQNTVNRTYGRPPSVGLPDVLGKHFKLQCSQYRLYWCGLQAKHGLIRNCSYKLCSIATPLIISRFKSNLYRAHTLKGFSVSLASAGMTYHAQAAWRRLSFAHCFNWSAFQPISRIARVVSFACARSNIASRVLAVIIGQASWAQNVWADSEKLQTSNSCYGRTNNNHTSLTTFIWELVEGLMLLLRMIYLMALFSPTLLMAPFADVFGVEFRKLWLQVLHWSLAKAGPAFIKWGQWAATRPDLFPRDFCDQLAKLHSKAPAHGFSYTKRSVESAFGRKLQEIFEDFEVDPVASGSIAQVHKAVLRFQHAGQEGKPMMVAVKVRHPGVREAISRDFIIINWIAKFLCFLPNLRWLRLDESLQQFAVFMLSQVDLAREAAHLNRFLYNFRRWKDVSFPKPLYPLVHPAVLVETYEQGESIAHYVEQTEGNYSVNNALANIGTNTFLKMLLVDNFIHADMHPGNILVRVRPGRPSRTPLFPSKPHVVLLDVGMTAELSENDRLNMLEFFKAIALRDGQAAAQCTLKFSRHQSCPDPDAFIKEVDSTFKFWHAPECKNVHQADCMHELLEQVRRHKVNIDGNVCTVMVTTLVLEGWQRKLDPSYDAIETLQALVLKADWTESLLYTIGGLVAP